MLTCCMRGSMFSSAKATIGASPGRSLLCLQNVQHSTELHHTCGKPQACYYQPITCWQEEFVYAVCVSLWWNYWTLWQYEILQYNKRCKSRCFAQTVCWCVPSRLKRFLSLSDICSETLLRERERERCRACDGITVGPGAVTGAPLLQISIESRELNNKQTTHVI